MFLPNLQAQSVFPDPRGGNVPFLSVCLGGFEVAKLGPLVKSWVLGIWAAMLFCDLSVIWLVTWDIRY